MRKTLGSVLMFTFILAPFEAGAVGNRSHMPAPKLKANELAPLCRVCNKGRACGDNCSTKKLA